MKKIYVSTKMTNIYLPFKLWYQYTKYILVCCENDKPKHCYILINYTL